MPTETQANMISHRGILLTMLVLILASGLLAFVLGGSRWAIGVLLGGGLSYINYLWLDRSTKAIFAGAHSRNENGLAARDDEEQTMNRGAAAIAALQYIFRYLALGGALLLVYLTEAVPMAAVLAGLSAFAIAVVVQGIKNTISS